MKKYYFVIQIFVVVVILILIGGNIIELRGDIEQLEVIDIVGLDETETGVKVTVRMEDNSSINSEDPGTQVTTTKRYKLIISEAPTFSQAVDRLKNVTDKYISMSHVKYYVVRRANC